MGKVEGNIRDFLEFRNFETLPYQKTFCAFQSSKNVPVYCERECACFTVQEEYGKIVFAGCSLKWLALCSNRGLLPFKMP